MTRRRVAVDWDGLEMALTWRLDEGSYYLEVETGEVIAWMGQEDDALSEDDIDAGLADGRLVAIEPLPSSVQFEWMEDFIATVRDPALRRRLERSLGGAGSFRRFKDALAERPSERDRWFAFQAEGVRAAAREWLEENGIEATSTPPATRPR